jgi:hypothetical protein
MVDRKSPRVGSNSKLKIQSQNYFMKSSYELAMERLNKTAPAKKLSDAQKKQFAELDSKYTAKIAEREIALKDEIGKAAAANDFEKAEKLREQLVVERKKLQAELEGKKEQFRSAK